MGVNAGKPIGKNGIILGILIAILYFANNNDSISGLFSKSFEPNQEQQNEHNASNEDDEYSNSVYKLLADEQLVYTKHAKERMICRTISKQEVNDILKNGSVNWKKTKKNDSPCPSYAIEGNTADGQTVRIIFADCNNATKVVTAIDLKNNYPCE